MINEKAFDPTKQVTTSTRWSPRYHQGNKNKRRIMYKTGWEDIVFIHRIPPEYRNRIAFKWGKKTESYRDLLAIYVPKIGGNNGF